MLGNSVILSHNLLQLDAVVNTIRKKCLAFALSDTSTHICNKLKKKERLEMFLARYKKSLVELNLEIF